LLSLSGIPPLIGFWGKFEIFTSALAVPTLEESRFLWLAVIGVLNAAIGAYYYLRIVVLMYLSPAREPIGTRGGWPIAAAAAVCAGLTIALGVFWTPVATTARSAARSAMAHPDPPRPQVETIAGVGATP
jgi:NADH-quinone oxidoreductase subunit N